MTCPSCGYCPHCGHSAAPHTFYPRYPQVVWGGGHGLAGTGGAQPAVWKNPAPDAAAGGPIGHYSQWIISQNGVAPL